MTTVKDMIIADLKSGCYDGLYYDGCGCAIDDLMPCCSWCGDCSPGYSITPPPEEGYDFWIGPKSTPEEKDEKERD